MFKKFVILLVILIVLIGAGAGLWFVWKVYEMPDFEGEKEFVVASGEGVNQISQNLFEKNIIKSKFAFETYVYLRGLEGSMQAGTYVMVPMNMIDLTNTLVAGKVDNETEIKLIEGWTIKEMAESLEKEGLVAADDFMAAARVENYRDYFDFLADVDQKTLEGYLFPDTYRIFKDATASEIVYKMLENFEQKMTSAFLTEITAKGRSLQDVITMASIIEMEVPNDEDRKIVSGILWKRLDIGMALQVDSSLKYAIGKENRNSLTYDELEIDSPYNTYKNQGLPPTAIANPGESAIRAAIYPKSSDYWFYLSDKEGNTIFSKDLDEHNANIEKYLK